MPESKRLAAHRAAIMASILLLSPLALCAQGNATAAAPSPAPAVVPATQPAVRFESIHAELAVASVPDAINYYRNTLGFAVEFQFGKPIVYAILARDSVRFAVVAKDVDYKSPSNLYINVNDIQKLYADLKDHATLDGAPAKKPWGNTEFVLTDNDGNRIRFAQSGR